MLFKGSKNCSSTTPRCSARAAKARQLRSQFSVSPYHTPSQPSTRQSGYRRRRRCPSEHSPIVRNIRATRSAVAGHQVLAQAISKSVQAPHLRDLQAASRSPLCLRNSISGAHGARPSARRAYAGSFSKPANRSSSFISSGKTRSRPDPMSVFTRPPRPVDLDMVVGMHLSRFPLRIFERRRRQWRQGRSFDLLEQIPAAFADMAHGAVVQILQQHRDRGIEIAETEEAPIAQPGPDPAFHDQNRALDLAVVPWLAASGRQDARVVMSGHGGEGLVERRLEPQRLGDADLEIVADDRSIPWRKLWSRRHMRPSAKDR